MGELIKLELIGIPDGKHVEVLQKTNKHKICEMWICEKRLIVLWDVISYGNRKTNTHRILNDIFKGILEVRLID